MLVKQGVESICVEIKLVLQQINEIEKAIEQLEEELFPLAGADPLWPATALHSEDWAGYGSRPHRGDWRTEAFSRAESLAQIGRLQSL